MDAYKNYIANYPKAAVQKAREQITWIEKYRMP